MALSDEWKHRIDRWEKALWQSCYRPLGTLALSGYTTQEHLYPEFASKGIFEPMPTGTSWGAKWEYGWFRSVFTLPEAARGQRIVLRLAPGGESMVWINGRAAGSIGWAHKEIPISQSACPGDTYDVILESYAGHGVVSIGEGPIRPGVEIMPEPGPAQALVGECTYGVWLEDVYQLALDFTTLYSLRGRLDPLSLRTSEIDECLMQATMIVDLELPEEEMLETARAARQYLQPLLTCINGSTAPTLYAFGHAHIDVAWLWPLAETRRKMARTAINQLLLFEEYPEYKFVQSEPELYRMLQEDYPAVYERFKAAIATGNLIPDGGMWVEADTNVSSGESLIRQILYGKRFFLDELGVDSKILWLPDVFGYSGAVPQILRGCGMEGFATQKITWAYGGGDPFPYNTFLWEGIDGTAIPAHIFTDYNSYTAPGNLLDRWETRLQKNGINSMIMAFGWGDGGGGPTRDHVEFLRRETNLEGLPRVRMATPLEFFQDLEKQGMPKERYVGELYFQAHRGTYTSQARTKQGNRRSEFALREAEFWATTARSLKDFEFTPRTLDEAWRKQMVNQFHDILPGSSIHRVYEEAEADFEIVIESANQTARTAAGKFIRAEKGTTVFNSLSWPRKVLIESPHGQTEVNVPACGWTSIEESVTTEVGGGVSVSENCLENDLIKVVFNARGELISLWDKETGRELMAAPGNCFCLYKDVPDIWDAWDLNSMTEQLPVALDEPVTLEVSRSGPISASILLTRRLHHSTLSQIISLRRGSRRIDFATTINWQESHKLLKVAFPVDVFATEAVHEIQFGHLRRPNHASRPYDADRFEVCNHKWSALTEENRGVALLNDCKYGISVKGNSLNLTLLKSAAAPDPQADRGTQTFTYSLYSWNGSLAESGVVMEAYDLNNPALVISGAAGEGQVFSLDAPNIVLEAVKPAEDGSTDVILRLYEAKRMATRCTLRTILPIRSAAQSDMLENVLGELELLDGKVKLDFRPFEIKTVRLRL